MWAFMLSWAYIIRTMLAWFGTLCLELSLADISLLWFLHAQVHPPWSSERCGSSTWMSQTLTAVKLLILLKKKSSRKKRTPKSLDFIEGNMTTHRISRRLDRNCGPAFPAWKMCVTNLVFDSISLAFYSIFPRSILPVTHDWATGPRMRMPSAIELFHVTDFSLSITEIEGSNWDQPIDIRSVSDELTLFVCENNTNTKTFPLTVFIRHVTLLFF